MFCFSLKALRTHTPDGKFKNETTAHQSQACFTFLRDCFKIVLQFRLKYRFIWQCRVLYQLDCFL